ncbi:MAG: type II secretion system protein GspJ [Deltaproteobacteria bacterium]|nr:type II secretion system protein GspJ [Deltaproteobacteria bacterium]
MRGAPTDRGGFTLIEVMIAIVITSIVLGMVYSSFQAVMDTRERVSASTNSNMTARLVLSRLSREIESAYIVQRPENAPPESRYTFFDGSEDTVDGHPAAKLSFTTFAHTKRALDADESDQSVIAYECEMRPTDNGEGQQLALIRREWRRVAPPGETQFYDPVPVSLAEGIEGFKLRFMEPEGGDWTELWNSEDIRTLDALPSAVEITLSLDDGRGIVRDYVTVASPRIEPITRNAPPQEGETVIEDDESEGDASEDESGKNPQKESAGKGAPPGRGANPVLPGIGGADAKP